MRIKLIKAHKINIAQLLLGIGLVAVLITSSSNTGGISNTAAGGCTCHGSANGATQLSISGLPSGGYINGQVYNLTLNITCLGSVKSGFNLLVNGGLLSNNPSGTSIINNGLELLHTTPQQMVAGTTAWQFSWQAPASGNAPVKFLASGNATNNNQQSSGDIWNKLDVNVYEQNNPPFAPSIVMEQIGITGIIGASLTAKVYSGLMNTTISAYAGQNGNFNKVANCTPSLLTADSANITAVFNGLSPNNNYTGFIVATNNLGSDTSKLINFFTAPNNIETVKEEVSYKILPNPASDFIKLQYASNSNLNLKIININGQIVLSMNNYNEADAIPIKALNNGIYFIKIVNKEQIITLPFYKY
jgi:hypothetical protein